MNIDLAAVGESPPQLLSIVHMRIDHSREHHFPGGIDHFLRLVFCREPVGFSDFDDPIVFDGNSAVDEDAPVWIHGHQPAGVLNQDRSHWHPPRVDRPQPNLIS